SRPCPRRRRARSPRARRAPRSSRRPRAPAGRPSGAPPVPDEPRASRAAARPQRAPRERSAPAPAKVGAPVPRARTLDERRLGLTGHADLLTVWHAFEDNPPVPVQSGQLSQLPGFSPFEGVRMCPLFGDRAMLNWIELAPDSVVPLHSHDNEQLGFVISGQI